MAETQITAMLQANPDINGIFAAHGNPGPGACAAVRNLVGRAKLKLWALTSVCPILS